MAGVKFIKPASKGLIVRDPKTMTALSDKGEYKAFEGTEGKYWNRRLNQGDIVIAESAVTNPIKEEEKKSFKKSKLGGKNDIL